MLSPPEALDTPTDFYFLPAWVFREGMKWGVVLWDDSYSCFRTMQTSKERTVDERQIEVICKVQGHLSFFFLSTLKVKSY